MRALIQSLLPEASLNADGKFNGDVVERLTEKLSQFVGPEAVQNYKEGRNERGELVNEEGLPIIDINEPVSLATKLRSSGSIPPLATVEPLLPLATLPPPARDRLRERRNRILDILEQEEQQEELRQAEGEEEALQKRREDAMKEKDKKKEARELQKKMGRALLQTIGKDKQKEEEEREAQRLRDEEADKRRSPSIKKKTVAFAESPDIADEDGSKKSVAEDWGDVVPARLQGTKRPTLLSQALLDRHPMKMSVVERVPGGQPTMPKTSPTPWQRLKEPVDSDDESDQEQDGNSDEEDTDVDAEPLLDADAVDLDYAQHQREIALQYYQKRNAIGQTAAAAMMNHSHDADEDKHAPNPDIVPDSSKPEISQFKANRIASAYGESIPTEATTTSLAGSVLPASSTRTIQRAIRTGKLDDTGKLVGGEDDSASEEEDQGLQEVLDLLRKGEVYNLGPDGKYIHAVRPTPGASPLQSTQTTDGAGASSSSASEQQQAPVAPPSMRSKTSKFKASLAAAGRPAAASSSTLVAPSASGSDLPSPSTTPVSHAGRSSPKTATPPPVGAVVPERVHSPFIKSPSPAKSPAPPAHAFSMIVDSPSFPMPQGYQPYAAASAAASAPMVISSPSFPAPPSARRPDRPPQVLATRVTESRPATQQPAGQGNGDSTTPGPERKVSRFKAERM
ncbi:hypothetical protein HYPSUDRAFT_52063 [Hypholoma sublateritium FD-334 SS-4]|uniref:DUF3835 domain-containing protein n=1 Tax=Hypholoma sublateritium (strain FD-334 SS-4) TaxID=945553 RepID=A0A0D2LHC0_HYPSF|nr:hypothetical protein HYPSUDRAFT_52063 [Hypholoma sublateritium FD-334 SS-4]